MEITEVRIYPGSDLVKAYATISIDNCFVVGEIRVMQGSTGLFVLFPAKKLTDGTRWDIAFPADTETRRRIEQAILAEYEKVAEGDLLATTKK
jgi:stage V sporulation protein G